MFPEWRLWLPNRCIIRNGTYTPLTVSLTQQPPLGCSYTRSPLVSFTELMCFSRWRNSVVYKVSTFILNGPIATPAVFLHLLLVVRKRRVWSWCT